MSNSSLPEQLEAERMRLFQAMAILSCIIGCVNRRDVAVDEPDIASAAEVAESMLNTCAGRLEEIGNELVEREGAQEVQS